METVRAFALRIKEHSASRRRGILNSGKHRIEGHGGTNFDEKCTIIKCETDESSTKPLEMFWISAQNPAMDNRNECLSTTSEFLPE